MQTIFPLKCMVLYLCTIGVAVSLDESHTPDSWPISEPLLLTNKISKPISYVFIREWHLDPPTPPSSSHAVTFLETSTLVGK